MLIPPDVLTPNYGVAETGDSFGDLPIAEIAADFGRLCEAAGIDGADAPNNFGALYGLVTRLALISEPPKFEASAFDPSTNEFVDATIHDVRSSGGITTVEINLPALAAPAKPRCIIQRSGARDGVRVTSRLILRDVTRGKPAITVKATVISGDTYETARFTARDSGDHALSPSIRFDDFVLAHFDAHHTNALNASPRSLNSFQLATMLAIFDAFILHLHDGAYPAPPSFFDISNIRDPNGSRYIPRRG